MASETGTTADHPEQLRLYILDVLQHDVAEQIDSIVCLLNNTGCIGWREFWSHDFTWREVLDALQGLLRDELIELFREDAIHGELVSVSPAEVNLEADMATLWFGRTVQGRDAWNAWEPPT